MCISFDLCSIRAPPTREVRCCRFSSIGFCSAFLQFHLRLHTYIRSWYQFYSCVLCFRKLQPFPACTPQRGCRLSPSSSSHDALPHSRPSSLQPSLLHAFPPPPHSPSLNEKEEEEDEKGRRRGAFGEGEREEEDCTVAVAKVEGRERGRSGRGGEGEGEEEEEG